MCVCAYIYIYTYMHTVEMEKDFWYTCLYINYVCIHEKDVCYTCLTINYVCTHVCTYIMYAYMFAHI